MHFHFHNKDVLSKQVKGTSACHSANKPESKLPAGHHGLTNSPAVPTGHSPGTAIKPDRSKVRQIVEAVAIVGPHLHSSFRRGPPSDQAYIHVLANGGHGQLGHRSCGGGSGGAWWVGLAFNSCSLNTLTIVFAPPVKSAFLQCHISNLSRLIFV